MPNTYTIIRYNNDDWQRHQKYYELGGTRRHNHMVVRVAPHTIGKSFIPGTVTSLGCGGGYEIHVMKKTMFHRSSFIGVEIAPKLCQIARDSCPYARIECADVTNKAVMNNLELPKAELCVALDVFEHLLPENREAFWDIVATLVHDRSMFYVEVPAFVPKERDAQITDYPVTPETDLIAPLNAIGFNSIDYEEKELWEGQPYTTIVAERL